MKYCQHILYRCVLISTFLERILIRRHHSFSNPCYFFHHQQAFCLTENSAAFTEDHWSKMNCPLGQRICSPLCRCKHESILFLTSPDIPMNSLAAGLDRSHFNQISTLFSQTWVDFLHDPSFQALHTLQCKKQQQQQQKKNPTS